MDTIKATLRQLAKKYAVWLFADAKPVSFVAGDLQEYDTQVIDGVDYSQPVILPGFVRRNPDAFKAFKESLTPVNALNQSATYRNDFGNPNRSGYDLPFAPTTEDPLKEWDWSTRERVLSTCHAAYQRNPLANAAVNFTTDFVIGDGFNLTCKNPDVRDILQAFIDNPDNAIRKYERQAVIDLQVDGELVIRYFEQGGEIVAVPQRPWELEWIKTEMGFYRRPELYRFQRYLTEGDAPYGTKTEFEEVPAADIQFVAINDHAYELRGRPELYRILPWLRAHKEAVEDRSRQNRWRGALLWHVKVANATPAILASVLARWRKPPAPGSAYVSSAFEEVNPLTNSSNAGDASTDIRILSLMVIIGMRLPEYFFGDGSNTNLATATRQQLPALTKFEAFQQIMVEQVWTPMFKRVIQKAIDAGALPEECDEYDNSGNMVYDDVEDDAPAAELPPQPLPTVAQIQRDAMNGRAPQAPMQPARTAKKCKTIDAFEVSYEPVAKDDLAALVNMLSTAVTNGWASNQTASEKLGFDTAIERERKEREERENLTAIAQGLRPMPPEMRPISDTGDEPTNARPQ